MTKSMQALTPELIDSRGLALLVQAAQVTRPAKLQHVDHWANENLVIPIGNAEPGKYQSERTPYIIDFMRDFQNVAV